MWVAVVMLDYSILQQLGTEYLVTLEESGGTDIGTFTIEGQQEVIIQKDPSDQLFAANAAVMAVGVAINSN